MQGESGCGLAAPAAGGELIGESRRADSCRLRTNNLAFYQDHMSVEETQILRPRKSCKPGEWECWTPRS